MASKPKAVDQNENVESGGKVVTLQQGLDSAIRGLDLFFENKFIDSKQLLSEHRDTSLYHAVGLSYYLICYAIFTCEKPLIEEARDVLTGALKLCEKKRKVNSIKQTLSNLFSKQDFNEYTDEEAHAEICYAELSFMMVFCNFTADQSFLSIVRGVRNMMTAHAAIKLSHALMLGKKNWDSEYVKQNFECACHNGWGYYNLVLSHLPARVLKLGAIVGLSASRDEGLKSLHIAADDMVGMVRSKISSFLACFYSFYWEQFFGAGGADIDWCVALTKKGLARFPGGAFDLYWAAKVHQLKGENDQAIEYLNRSLSSQSEFKQLHNVLFWDLSWCHAMNGEWEKAAEYAKRLQLDCAWSPSTNCYQYACFMYMLMDEDKRPEIRAIVDRAMAEVPKLRHRFAGKTIPPEKYAIVMAERYNNGETDLALPAYNLFYIWNIFGNSSETPKLLEPILDRIENQLSRHSSGDSHYALLFLKGVVLRYRKNFNQALECFQEILISEAQIDKDTYLPPQAAFELGMTYKDMADYDNAKIWLEKARSDYTGFLVETLVHFRIHTAMQKIKEIQRSK